MDDVTALTQEAARSAREAAGMTLRTAASLLHIDFTYLSKVENGHERPSDALLLRMGEVYGFDGPAAVLARRVAEVPDDVRAAIEAAAARRAIEGSGVVSVEALDLAAAKEMLLWVLTFTPEPYTVRRGASAGGEVLWGEPEPGSYTPEDRLESALQLAPHLLRDLATGTALRLAAVPRPEEPRVECWYPGCVATPETHNLSVCIGGGTCASHHPPTPEAR